MKQAAGTQTAAIRMDGHEVKQAGDAVLRSLSERLREEAESAHHGEHRCGDFSAGCRQYQALVAAADHGLYAAKEGGRNRVCHQPG